MKILIATDGSKYSKAAIEKSCRLFSAFDSAEIKIISVHEEVYPMPAAPIAISAEYYRELTDASIQQAKHFADEGIEMIRSIRANGDSPSDVEIVKGNPAREIVKLAEQWGADVIVVGSHGYGFWSRALVGSVSDAVVHHAPCSVLVVRDRENKNE